jgi:hypothetical protein
MGVVSDMWRKVALTGWRWSSLSIRFGVLVAAIGGMGLFASSAVAEMGSISVIGPNANNALGVQVSITVTQSDCSPTNGCAWSGQATAEPSSSGCGSFPDQSALIWTSSQLQDGPGTDTETFNVPMNDFAGTFDLCLYAYDPAVALNELFGQTTYTFPSPTGSATATQQADGSIAGAVTVRQTLCGENNCPWFASMTQQPGGGACPATPNSSQLVWVGPTEAGIGTFSWPYSFVPGASSGLLGLCIYIYQGDLSVDQLVGSGSVYLATPQSSPTPTSSGTSTQLPTLTLSAAKGYMKTALKRRLGPLSSLTESACGRLSRTRIRCHVTATTTHRVRWVGTVSIWLSRASRGVEWNYAMSLKSGHRRLVVH